MKTIFAAFSSIKSSLDLQLLLENQKGFNLAASNHFVDNSEPLNYYNTCNYLAIFGVTDLTLITITKTPQYDYIVENFYSSDNEHTILSNNIIPATLFFSKEGITNFIIKPEVYRVVEVNTNIPHNEDGIKKNKTSFRNI